MQKNHTLAIKLLTALFMCSFVGTSYSAAQFDPLRDSAPSRGAQANPHRDSDDEDEKEGDTARISRRDFCAKVYQEQLLGNTPQALNAGFAELSTQEINDEQFVQALTDAGINPQEARDNLIAQLQKVQKLDLETATDTATVFLPKRLCKLQKKPKAVEQPAVLHAQVEGLEEKAEGHNAEQVAQNSHSKSQPGVWQKTKDRLTVARQYGIGAVKYGIGTVKNLPNRAHQMWSHVPSLDDEACKARQTSLDNLAKSTRKKAIAAKNLAVGTAKLVYNNPKTAGTLALGAIDAAGLVDLPFITPFSTLASGAIGLAALKASHTYPQLPNQLADKAIEFAEKAAPVVETVQSNIFPFLGTAAVLAADTIIDVPYFNPFIATVTTAGLTALAAVKPNIYKTLTYHEASKVVGPIARRVLANPTPIVAPLALSAAASFVGVPVLPTMARTAAFAGAMNAVAPGAISNVVAAQAELVKGPIKAELQRNAEEVFAEAVAQGNEGQALAHGLVAEQMATVKKLKAQTEDAALVYRGLAQEGNDVDETFELLDDNVKEAEEEKQARLEAQFCYQQAKDARNHAAFLAEQEALAAGENTFAAQDIAQTIRDGGNQPRATIGQAAAIAKKTAKRAFEAGANDIAMGGVRQFDEQLANRRDAALREQEQSKRLTRRLMEKEHKAFNLKQQAKKAERLALLNPVDESAQRQARRATENVHAAEREVSSLQEQVLAQKATFAQTVHDIAYNEAIQMGQDHAEAAHRANHAKQEVLDDVAGLPRPTAGLYARLAHNAAWEEAYRSRNFLLQGMGAVGGIGTTFTLLAYLWQYGGKVFFDWLDRKLKRPTLLIDSSHESILSTITGGLLKDREKPPKMVFSPEQEERLGTIAKAVKNIRSHIRKGKKNVTYRNLLLYGSPGTGKTMYAKKLAKESGMDFVLMSGGSFSQFRDGTAITEIDKLFAWINKESEKGVIVFIDEVDSLLVSREKLAAGSEDLKIVNHILQYTGERSDKFMLIMTTNHKDNLDKAIVSRVDDYEEMLLPDINMRKDVLAHYIETIFFNTQDNRREFVTMAKGVLTQAVITNIAERTEGWSNREICSFVNTLFSNLITTDELILTPTLIEKALHHAQKKMQLDSGKETREAITTMTIEQVLQESTPTEPIKPTTTSAAAALAKAKHYMQQYNPSARLGKLRDRALGRTPAAAA